MSEKKKFMKKLAFICPKHGNLDGKIEYISIRIGNKLFEDVAVVFCEQCEKYYTPFSNLLSFVKGIKHNDFPIYASKCCVDKSIPRREVRVPQVKDILNNIEAKRSESHSKAAIILNKLSNFTEEEIIPLVKANTKAMRPDVHVVNYQLDKCPICKKRLIEYKNIIPVTISKGVKLEGLYCTKCGLFCTEDIDLSQRLSRAHLSTVDYHIHTDYLIPNFSEKMKTIKAQKSISFALHLRSKESGEHRTIGVVTSTADRDWKKSIFYYTDDVAREAFLALRKKQGYMKIDSVYYDILLCSSIGEYPKHSRVDRLTLANGGGFDKGYFERSMEIVEVLLYSSSCNSYEVAKASYYADSEAYFMDARIYADFVGKYGVPEVQTVWGYPKGSSENGDLSSLKQKSFLGKAGYSVNASEMNRRRALAFCVQDYGKTKVINQIKFNIDLRDKQKKYARAIYIWKKDIEFIQNEL